MHPRKKDSQAFQSSEFRVVFLPLEKEDIIRDGDFVYALGAWWPVQTANKKCIDRPVKDVDLGNSIPHRPTIVKETT